MSLEKIRILIVIPLFNHGKTVMEVAHRCRALHPDILIIDDGSTDLPDHLLSDSGIPTLYHQANQGKGAALMTAAQFALKNNYTHMVSIDADLQHLPEDFLLFKEQISKTPQALIVGKRDFSSPAIPLASRHGRTFSNFWFRIQTGLTVGDAQSGFRAYPLGILNQLSLSQTHYDFEIEVLVKASWAGVEVRDLDISVHYPAPDIRVSHFKLFLDNLRLTHLNTWLTIRSFLPWPHKQLLKKETALKFSIFHPLKSIKHFLAHEVSPFEIAISGAVGIFLGTLPLVAMHTLAILIVTGFFRLNKLVAVGTSQFCMPPFVPALCIQIGYFITHGGRFLTDISFETLGYQFLDRFYEWCLGSLVAAPMLGGLFFIIIYLIAQALTVIPEGEQP